MENNVEDNIILYGYHVTDLSNVDSIKREGFHIGENDEHWLGTGVYFFIDPALALKWSRPPTRKYSKIKKPAYFKVKIKTLSYFVCDMRLLDDYNKVYKSYEFFKSYVQKSNGIGNFSIPKMRNVFFNWLVKKYELKCIVGNFTDRSKNLLTVSTCEGDFIKNINMPYTETQICVSDTQIIVSTKIVDLRKR